MDSIFNVYDRFLAIFPPHFQGIISLFVFVLVIFAIYKIIKKDFIWIIALILLLPASISILSKIWNSLVEFLQYLINKSSL